MLLTCARRRGTVLRVGEAGAAQVSIVNAKTDRKGQDWVNADTVGECEGNRKGQSHRECLQQSRPGRPRAERAAAQDTMSAPRQALGLAWKDSYIFFSCYLLSIPITARRTSGGEQTYTHLQERRGSLPGLAGLP